jgi:cytochrome c6
MKLCPFMIASVLAATLNSSVAAQSAGDLYKSRCQGCHGANGKASFFGKRMGAKAFSDPDVANMSEVDLIKVITDGKDKMPSYKGKLTDDQIKSLARYIKDMK